MSDFCLYELEDISWDEFCHDDDHTVPHPSCGHPNELPSQSDSRKKPRYEVAGSSSPIGDRSTVKYANQRKEQEELPPTMLEKDSWADVPVGVFPSTCDKDSVKGISSLASEKTSTSSHCFKSSNIDSSNSELGADGPILDNKNAAVEENVYSYPLGPISQEDDLRFFEKNPEDEDSNNLLYCSWSEIENFDDVDRMFRSCDSTFGLGAGNGDELDWFSSSDVIEGSGDGLMPEFKFPCPASSALENISGRQEASRPMETDSSINNSDIENQPLSYNGSSWPSGKNELANQIFNESSDSKCKLVPEMNINMHKKHSKHQNRSEGERKGFCLMSGDTFDYNDSLPEEAKHPIGTNRSQVNFTSADIQQQKQAHRPDIGYLQGGFSYMPSDYSRSDRTALHPTLSMIKSENSSLMSLSTKDSYASNQVESMESSPDPSSKVAAITAKKRKVEKPLHHSGIKFRNNSDPDGVSIGNPSELGSSTVQENSSIGSGLDEISEEAASFQQLQRVMEQLDIRTKLCIRDSLYRLAQSAEQRNRHANLNNGSGGDRDTSGAFINEGTNMCTGYLDIETDTNSIDRTIAHLLFHRPSDSSVAPASDSLAVKLPSMIHGSSTSLPVMGENLICDGEMAAETDREVADH